MMSVLQAVCGLREVSHTKPGFSSLSGNDEPQPWARPKAKRARGNRGGCLCLTASSSSSFSSFAGGCQGCDAEQREMASTRTRTRTLPIMT